MEIYNSSHQEDQGSDEVLVLDGLDGEDLCSQDFCNNNNI